ncbi:MAG: hypothetical protein N0E44_18070 [Candidatus Thiodiazotropha lotti]|nr:hypothetical protein [Candidatus Thiodiazotropha lotti]MCW4221791.1 hypothetical protein [Candidatus Thiodiazotropha lotti]
MAKKTATKSEKAYMDRVAQLPCALTGESPVELHHIREGQGMSERASNYLVIPLSPEAHRGPLGVHGDKTLLRIHKVTELDLLADTINKVFSGCSA